MKRLILALLLTAAAHAATLHVGTGQTYTTIQAACTAAVAGDTVFVHAAGSPYAGCNIAPPHVSGTATNRITIMAENSSVVVNSPGDLSGDGFDIEVSYVTVSGFEVTGMSRIGIRVVADAGTGNIVVNNYVHNNTSTGVLSGFQVNFQVLNNHITANGTTSGEHNLYISNSDTGYNGIEYV